MSYIYFKKKLQVLQNQTLFHKKINNYDVLVFMYEKYTLLYYVILHTNVIVCTNTPL